MNKVRFTKWESGVKSVRLTKFIRSKTTLSLTQSREEVDKFLSGEPIVVDFTDLSEEDISILASFKVKFELFG